MARPNSFIKPKNLGELSEASFVSKPVAKNTPSTFQPESSSSLRMTEKLVGSEKHLGHSILISCVAVLLCFSMAFSSYLGLWENGSFDLGLLSAKKITLIINGSPYFITSDATYVEDFLSEQSIKLTDDDSINVETGSFLDDGMTIRIVKSVNINILADGKEYQITSMPITVKEAIKQAGIVLGAEDLASVSFSQYIYDDIDLEIYRVTTKIVSETEEIEPTITRKESSYLEAGTSETLSTGNKGIRETKYKVSYSNDVEVARELISSEIIKEPGTTVVAYGTMVLSSRGESSGSEPLATTVSGNSFSYVKKISVEATAYTATGNKTATGTWPKVGTIAVDPKYIPLGTKVYIEGYGFATAEDTGGAIKGYIIDLYMDSYDECINWGRQDTTLYILE